MSETLVDIGIPVAGRTAYIGRAIESVLAQTLDRWRLTISEDGAKNPAVHAVVEPYLADARITFVATGRQLGPPRIKTLLVRTGDAPFVALLDDDDLWQPEFLEEHVRFAQSNPEVGFVFCANNVIDGAGLEIGGSRVVLSEGAHGPDEMVLRLLEHNLVASPTILIRRTALAEVGGTFDERLFTCYDLDMWLRLAARFPVGYRASRDASYRQHANQSTVLDRSRRSDELLLMLDKVEAESMPPTGRLAVGRIIRRRRASTLLSVAMDELEAGNRRRAVQNLRNAIHVSPRIVGDPRSLVIVATTLVPGSARGLRAARTFTLRHGLRGGTFEPRPRQRPRRSR